MISIFLLLHLLICKKKKKKNLPSVFKESVIVF